MKQKKNKAAIIIVIVAVIFTLIAVVVAAAFIYYNTNISPVSNDTNLKQIDIQSGTIESIGITLKENNLIKDVTIFKLYTRITEKTNLKAGIYELSESMSMGEIVNILEEGSTYNPDEISITFKEGINIRTVAELISENTNNSYDDVIALMNNDDYINSLIDKYWFLTDDILNTNIYYPLEGYLFPNTYRFVNIDVSAEDIIEKMLNETDKKLTEHKKAIEKSNLNIHELITLASIVELEGANASDRKGVAGVFYNRLNSSSYPTLGSDATTYYASKIDDWSVSLTYRELNDCTNKYNTRCNLNTGLPVGPICNPSLESIESTINPENHDYYYFVADCKGEVYLTKNSNEHTNIINKLRRENNWCA